MGYSLSLSAIAASDESELCFTDTVSFIGLRMAGGVIPPFLLLSECLFMQFVNDFEAALFKYSLRCLTLRLIAISDGSALRISGV